MSLLQFIVLISAVIFILFGIDLFKRKKMNILHFLIFFFGGWLLVIFALNQSLLDKFWKFFGIARWADLIVYAWLILLLYFYIDLLNKQTKDKFQLTKLISEEAINLTYEEEKDNIVKWINHDFKDEFIFNVRSYNEANSIWNVIDEIFQAWFNKILVVNDGSTDNSSEILNQKKQQYSDKLLIIVSHRINRWGGAANQSWYNFVKKHWDELKIQRFVWFDADWQMNIKDMETFIKAIKKNEEIASKDKQRLISTSHWSKVPDLYLGSRFIEWSVTENMPPMRKVILKISRIVTRIFYGAKVSDPHIGYKVISLQALRKFNITADGMHYANEINEQIRKYRLKYQEIPVHIRYTQHSLTKAHRQKNSNSRRLAAEMIYKKLFFK